MLVRVFVAVILIVAALRSPAMAQTRPDTEDLARLDAYLEQEIEQAGIPGIAIAVVRDGEIVHARGFGVTGPEGQPMTPQTPHELGSVSKPLTATAVMQLVEAGAITLDTPIQEVLPDFALADERAAAKITLRHILTHTSGIGMRTGRMPFGRTDMDADALQRRVRELKTVSPESEPGTQFSYSNTNYMLSGAVIEAVSGQSYESYVTENVLAPLGMTASSATVQNVQDLATGHRYFFGTPSPASDLPRTRISTPSGFLVSSAEDMGRYLVALLNRNPALLSPAGIDTLTARHHVFRESLAYGLGWFVRDVGGTTVVHHGGTTERFFTELMMAPEEGWGAILLVNSMGYTSGPNVPKLAENVRDVLMSNDVEPVGRAQFGMLLWVLGGLLILQVAGAIHSGFLFRRWKRSPDRRPKAPWKKWGWHLSLPLLGNLALAGICLVALPYAFGLHLTGMRMYAPDAALLAIIGGVWALVWGIGRTGWCLRLIRATVDDAPPMVPSAARDREPVPPTITR